MLGSEDLFVELHDDSICDIVQVLEQDVVWTINYNFGQTRYGSLMMHLVGGLLKNGEWHSQELEFEQLHLLLLVVELVHDVPDKLSDSLTDGYVKSG